MALASRRDHRQAQRAKRARALCLFPRAAAAPAPSALASAARPGRPWPLLRRGPRPDGQPINGVNREESLLACDERLAASLMARQTDTSKPARRVTRRGRGRGWRAAEPGATTTHKRAPGCDRCCAVATALACVTAFRPCTALCPEQARYYSAQNRLLGSFVRTLGRRAPLSAGSAFLARTGLACKADLV